MTIAPHLVFRSIKNNKFNVSLMYFSKNNKNIECIFENFEDYTKKIKFINNCIFYIFELAIPMKNERYLLNYTIETNTYTINIPAISEKIQILYTSCNNKCTEMENNWKRVNNEYFNILIGGGDQVYADDVFKLKCVENIVETYKKNKEEFLNHKLSDDDISCIENFYIDLYINYYSTNNYNVILSKIPSINILDDHEIFDGFGSYNDYINNSIFCAKIKEIAYKYYLIFQHHIFEETDKANFEYYGEYCYNKTYKFYDTIIFAIDHRAERTRNRLLTNNTFELLKNEVEKANYKYKNYLFLLGIPIAFPHCSTIEDIIKSGEKNKIISKLLMQIGGKNMFGEFEGYDDVIYDSWNCEEHEEEKNKILDLMFTLDTCNKEKIIILSGDSHLGGLSNITKNNKIIYHIMSSGIGSMNETNLIANFVEKQIKLSPKIKENEIIINFIKYEDEYIIGCRNWIFLNFNESENTSYKFYREDEGTPLIFTDDKFINKKNTFNLLGFCCCLM